MDETIYKSYLSDKANNKYTEIINENLFKAYSAEIKSFMNTVINFFS